MSRFKILARLAALTVWLLSAVAGNAQMTGEYRLKALFIYNFAKFVEWPTSAFANPNEPIKLCIVGRDPFGADLDQAVIGKTISSRELLVKRIPKGAEPVGCQVLFLGAGEGRHARQMLAEFASAPVLTVGDSKNFPDGSLLISFCMEAGKVRFNINLDAAERAHLKISSKLLNLAKSVREPDK
jgi:hypothetical protein